MNNSELAPVLADNKALVALMAAIIYGTSYTDEQGWIEAEAAVAKAILLLDTCFTDIQRCQRG